MICVRSPSWFECPEVLQFSRFSSVINDPSTAVSSQPTSVVLLNASLLLVVSLIFLFSFLLFFPFRFFFFFFLSNYCLQQRAKLLSLPHVYARLTRVSRSLEVRRPCRGFAGLLFSLQMDR